MLEMNLSLLNTQNSLKIKKETVAELLKKRKVNELWEGRISAVDTIIIHYMSAINTTPKAPFKLENLIEIFINYEVSAHYLILRDGTIYNLVPEDKKAWHAGASQMPKPDLREGVNDFSIGIELVGAENQNFTDEQYMSLKDLIKDIKQRNQITTILGHQDIAGIDSVKAGIRDDIKIDPGKNFDWSRI
jgi:N-acetyl-anhydromuramyl-L-alanine amidase AmpD